MCQVRNCDNNKISPPRLSLQLREMTCTTFTLFPAQTALIFTLRVNFAVRLKQLKVWRYKNVLDPGDMCQNEAALYTDARSHVMHILLKEGGQLLQSTGSPFQTGLCSLDPWAAGSNYLPGQDTAVQLASDSIMVQGQVKQVTASPGSYKQQK